MVYVCKGMLGKISARDKVAASESKFQYSLAICSVNLSSKKATHNMPSFRQTRSTIPLLYFLLQNSLLYAAMGKHTRKAF